MYYEINVALNGKHFFATAKRSITSISTLKAVYSVLKEKFPESEGFSISVTKWETVGHEINMEEV